MNRLELTPLTPDLIPAARALDELTLGGMWTEDGYRRELDSENALLLALVPGEAGFRYEGLAQPVLLSLTCLWLIAEEAHLTLMAVHPDYRRQGFGQTMLMALMDEARRRGMEWMTLEVRKSNQMAIALYKKFGFVEIGYRKRYYTNPEEDALILWCKGLQQPEFKQSLKTWEQQVCDRLYQQGWQLSPASISNFYTFV